MNIPALPPDFTLSATKRVPQKVRKEQRREQILQASIAFLAYPDSDHLTLLQLAKKIGTTSAAVRQHFADKLQLFLALIDHLENQIFGLINQVENDHDDGIHALNKMVEMLFELVENEPGLTKILTNEAFFLEDKSLHVRMQQCVDRMESSFRQLYRIAAAQGHIQKGQESDRAHWLLSYILGALVRFSRSSFTKKPSQAWVTQKKWLV